jgi:NADH-quinone oxidoreductase subunit C
MPIFLLQPRPLFDRLVEAWTMATSEEAAFSFEEAGGKDGARDAYIRVPAPRVAEVMKILRDDPALRFDFLQNLTAVDWIKRDVMEVVYHLFSYPHRHAACVKVEVARAAPRLPSVAGVWPTANWLEREQYDLLGVVFEGHPDLRRLLMPDDWVGHPMRKDYHEAKSYRGMPTSRPSPLELLQTYDRAHVAPATEAHAPTATTAPAKPEGTR